MKRILTILLFHFLLTSLAEAAAAMEAAMAAEAAHAAEVKRRVSFGETLVSPTREFTQPGTRSSHRKPVHPRPSSMLCMGSPLDTRNAIASHPMHRISIRRATHIAG